MKDKIRVPQNNNPYEVGRDISLVEYNKIKVRELSKKIRELEVRIEKLEKERET